MGARIKIIFAVAVVLVVGLVVVLVITGLGSDDEQASQAGASGQPKYGGTLVVAAVDPGVLNPALTSSGTTHPVTGQIFNGLVRLDDQFNPKPDLARDWEISPDGRTYSFQLARGVRWHDGEPFSSADVKFTFEEVLLELNPRTRGLADVIESIDTPDENTVVFRLKERYTPFIKFLDEDNGAILPKHIYEGTDPLTNPANAEPVGTGPFKLESQVKGQEINLVRNGEYFKEGRPYLDRIVFRIIAAPPQALQAVLAGEVNLWLFPAPPATAQLRQTPGLVVTEKGRKGFARVIRLIPNLRREPFDDVRVRQAMAYAIDSDFVARTAYAGTLKPATGPLSQDFERFYAEDVEKYPRNLEKAKQLLDAAGLEPGEDGMRFRTSLIFDQSFAPAAEIVKEQLKEVGIELDLRVMEFNAWVKKLYIDQDFELGYSQLTDPPDPDVGMRRIFTCSNIVKAPFANGAGYCNRRVDRLFDRATQVPEGPERVELYREIQRIIAREQPHVFLVDGIGPWAYDSDFRGITDAGAKSPYYFGETTWWTKGSASREG